MRISDWSSDVCSSDLGLRVARVLRAADLDPLARVEPFAQGVGRQVQRIGRQQRALDVVAALLVALAGLLPELVGRFGHADRHQRQSVVAEVVEQRRGAVEEQRQVVLDARRRVAGLEVLEQRAAPGVRSEETPSEHQSLMRISYAVFGLTKKNKNTR